MKKFLGLLKREHMMHSTHVYVVLALVVLAISVLPIGIERYNPIYEAEQNRFIIVIACAIAAGANAVFMTVSSINRDIKMKDLWLHNTQSIYTLIGVKALYQYMGLLLIGLVNFLGLLFVGEIIEGTISQFIVLVSVYVYILTAAFVSFVSFVIFYNSLLKQLSAWLGKLGTVIGFFGLFAFVSFSGNQTVDVSFLQVGYVSFASIEKYLPNFNDTDITVSLLFEFYPVQELLWIVFFVSLYVVACKWLERVITR